MTYHFQNQVFLAIYSSAINFVNDKLYAAKLIRYWNACFRMRQAPQQQIFVNKIHIWHMQNHIGNHSLLYHWHLLCQEYFTVCVYP